MEDRFSHLYSDSSEVQEDTIVTQEKDDLMSVLMSRPKPVFEAPVAETLDTATDTQDLPETPGTEAQQPRVQQKTAKELENTARRSAEMWTATLTMATKMVCSAISGQPAENYAPEKTDREEYVTVCTNYFAEVGEIMSPKTLFIISSLSFFGAMIAKSLGDRKNASAQQAAAKQYKEAKKEYEQAVEKGDKEVIETAIETLKVVSKQPKRNHFQVDANDYYTHDLNNNHIKGPKPEKCTDPRILEIIHHHRKGKTADRLKWGAINEKVRMMLYGHEHPVKNE